MTFISYAQNLEDLVLFRALGHIDKGFYIDVGAAWPDEHSVTKVFYDRGWKGVNIEPNPELYFKLCTERRRDINLQIAIGDENGEAILNVVNNTGLSSLSKENLEQLHQSIQPVPVAMRKLSHVWADEIPSSQDVHFLKIDVEGLELPVIRGNDWRRFRPWVVVVEATRPSTNVENHVLWEELLLNEGYTFVYADGLNRFYVAIEHSNLCSHFKYPPNIFDNFITARQLELESLLQQAKRQRLEQNRKLETLEKQIQQILASTSWRLTVPVRWAGYKLRLHKNRLRNILNVLAGKIRRNPQLYRTVNFVLKRIPLLKLTLHRLSFSQSMGVQPQTSSIENPRTQQIYYRLKAAHRAHDGRGE